MALQPDDPARVVTLGDLIGTPDIASMLGLSSYRSVTTLRARHPDFPPPALTTGRWSLWVRADIERWAQEHRRDLRDET